MRLVSMLAVAVLTFSGSAVAATVYRWVDQAGHVTYQDTPPPPGAHDVQEQDLSSGASISRATHAPVIVYVIPHCPPCDSIRHFLTRRNVPFTEINIAADPKLRADMETKTGYASVPTVSVGKTNINGFIPSWLQSELTKAGYDLARSGPSTPQKP